MMLNFWPVILLMQSIDLAMVWAQEATIDLRTSLGTKELDAAYLKLARDLLPSIQRRRQVRLGDLLSRHAPPDQLEIFVGERRRDVDLPQRVIDAHAKARFATDVQSTRRATRRPSRTGPLMVRCRAARPRVRVSWSWTNSR